MPRNPNCVDHTHANPEATRGKRWGLKHRVAEFEAKVTQEEKLRKVGLDGETLEAGAARLAKKDAQARARREYWQLKQLHRD